MSQRYIGGLIYNPPGGFSGYFDGSGDQLTAANSAAFDFGSGDFTIETWVYLTGTTGSVVNYSNGQTQNSNFAWEIYQSSATSIQVSVFQSTTQYAASSNALVATAWNHVAGVRSGNTLTIYVNGVAGGTTASVAGVTVNNPSGSTIKVSGWNNAAAMIAGYLSNLRIVKGAALYTSNFTPPTGPLQAIANTSLLTCAYSTFRDGSANNFAITVNGNAAVSTQNPFPQTLLPNPALGNAGNGVYTMSQYQALRSQNLWPAIDPYWEYVTLMLHGNGTNGAQNNTFLDSSTNNFTVTRNGNTTQGAFSPYGDLWSNYFDGSGDYLTVTSASLQLGTSDFTLEFFINLSTLGAVDIDFWRPPGNTGMVGIGIYNFASDIRIVEFTGGTTLVDFGPKTQIPTNQWAHIAITRSGSTFRCFINGVISSTGARTSTASLSSTSNTFQIMRDVPPAYVSNYRLLIGTALYTSNFTPPTAPLTAITNTSLLTCQSNRFIDNSSNNFTITRNGDVRVQRFSPFHPTAPYAAGTIGGSGYFDGSGDYLVCGAASDWAFMSNSTALWSVEMWVYPTVLGSDTTLLDTAQSTTANVGMAMQINANRTVQVEIYRGSAGTYVVTGDSTSTLVANQWNHILATYDQSLASQNLKLYINGGSAETTNKTGNAPSSSNPNRAMTIATYGAGGGQFFTGYIGSMRISNVIRSSGVPTAPYTSDANTVLLTNYTNGGIIDNAMMNDLETIGNAQISTSVSKFGGGSLAFDGTGDGIGSPNNPNAVLASGDFTIEMWVRLIATGSFYRLIALQNGTASNANYSYDITVNTNGTVVASVYSGTTVYATTSTTALSTSAWTHIAYVRSGTTQRLYINGVSEGTPSTVSTFNTIIDGRLWIGIDNGSTFSLNGYIDELRITKGVARYTTNFIPQRSQWQDQ